MYQPTSVTRLGDLSDFGQLFKAFCNNYFAQISHILCNFCKCVKIFHFYSEIIFGQLLNTFGDFFLVTLQPIYLPTFVLLQLQMLFLTKK